MRLRRLGAQLRKVREDAGLTLEEAGIRVQHSRSTLSRIENAQLTVRPHDVEYILWKYGITDEQLRHSLIGLAKAGRQKGWWQSYKDAMTQRGADWISLEQDSSEIRTFQPIVVPGLLQTPGYARALMLGVPQLPGADIDRGIALRAARQRVLTRPEPCRLHVVLDESVIRRRIGGAEVMRAQLVGLLESIALDNVTLRILALGVESNPGVDGGFVVADVRGGGFSIVFTEGLCRSSFAEDDAEVDRYNLVHDSLRALALTESESRSLIEQVLREF